MGETRTHLDVLPIVAIFSRHDDARAWALDRAKQVWGDVAVSCEPYAFTETAYYEAPMGTDLVKQIFAFEQLCPPDSLAAAKLRSNTWEDEYKRAAQLDEDRPLNIDPGYLTEAKLVLATTKDRDHRIYLSDGIYAEVTTYFRQGAWQAREWTYADYRRAEVTSFLDRCRQYLRDRYRTN